MRRITLAIILSCLTLSLMAQSGIKVNYKGSRPTVADFAWAAFPSLNYEDEEESGDRPWRALENAMKRHSKGLAQEEGEKLIIDSKNGYILFEHVSDEHEDYIFRLEVASFSSSATSSQTKESVKTNQKCLPSHCRRLRRQSPCSRLRLRRPRTVRRRTGYILSGIGI